MTEKQLRVLFLLMFLAIFGGTAVLALIGVVLSWQTGSGLPFVEWLLGITIAEIAVVVIAYAKGDLGLSPRGMVSRETYESAEKINAFLRDFVGSGSRVDIFSGELSWVRQDPEMKRLILEKARSQRISMYLPAMNEIADELERGGVNVIDYSVISADLGVRFTLLNRGESGSQALAIGVGTVPDFLITVYNDRYAPQIVTAFARLITLIETCMDMIPRREDDTKPRGE